MKKLSCFKAYDVRGKLGEELNDEIAYNIGRAFAETLSAKKVVVGGDVRLTSESLKENLARGLCDAGCDVIDLGLTGTEEIYFATTFLNVDGGIEVTASHNPIDYNGMKFVGKNSVPISSDNELIRIQELATRKEYKLKPLKKGVTTKASVVKDYINHVISYIDHKEIRPLRILTNAGNGTAGNIINAIEEKLKSLKVPIEFIKINNTPDGSFPNGIPNPLIKENQEETSKAVLKHDADIGVAWDGDFDRCFLFDEKGRFIEGYYIVGLLAEAFLKKNPNEKIIHDPRLIWNTIATVEKNNGTAIESKTGHAFIKDRMRSEDAIYGGEMSAHHYFRDFFYCDSGMIPWLLIIELLSKTKSPLSNLVDQSMKTFPCSGELNFVVKDKSKTISKINDYFLKKDNPPKISLVDGLSMDFNQWRFNLRASNTEHLLRLNVETRGADALLEKKVTELSKLIISSHH